MSGRISGDLEALKPAFRRMAQPVVDGKIDKRRR
jgi:hypothetical protein